MSTIFIGGSPKPYSLETVHGDMFSYFQPQFLPFLRSRPRVILSTRGLLFIFLIFSATNCTAVNVTVDDGDQRIIYSPTGAWTRSAQSSLNYGGSHMLTQNASATAVFSFSGEQESFYFTSSFLLYGLY